MTTSLPKEDRKLLEKTTAEARVLAESASRAALENIAVHEKEYRVHMSVEQRLLRNRLRARGRALGDKRDERSGIQEIHHLNELAAYEHWHRLLFSRFLTENHLLITDPANGSVPVTLEECEELAPELGARDGLDLACRFASVMLPGVFRRDDPVLELPIAINDQVELRKLLAILPAQIFRADDSLGWTYQFWQAQRKDEVNASGKKIGADELAPVTQLFTEDYMVEFLLHNTIGAWWAGKIGPIRTDTEEEARAQTALPPLDGVSGISWTYLRFVQNETTKTWLPAAGTFGGWPKLTRLIRLLDPCMGSGHFLVFALPLLVRLRMEEEKLSAQAAVGEVLTDNIHGLELDERCTQIAAFNVALTAWKLAGYQALPILNLACSGLAPSATKEEWMALAGDNDRLQRGMARLHNLFKDAPILGSLINPRALTGDLIEAEFRELQPLLEKALGRETKDDNTYEMVVITRGIAKAAELLAEQFTLVATNVPYLGNGNQNEILQIYCERFHPLSKADLATCFIERCIDLCVKDGTTALVTPQNWLFLKTYTKLRRALLGNRSWNLVTRLGSGAFETISGQVVNVALPIISVTIPVGFHTLSEIDVSMANEPEEKAAMLRGCNSSKIALVNQEKQLLNPDALIGDTIGGQLLSEFADTYEGLSTGDIGQFIRVFWEIDKFDGKVWASLIGSVRETTEYGGREQILLWEEGNGKFVNSPGSYLKGAKAWGKYGLRITLMSNKCVTLYTGELFDKNAGTLIPKNIIHLPALAAYCSSDEYEKNVKVANPSLYVPVKTLLKVPFDLDYWTKIANEKYPDGLPKPHSDDPTQWLFNGHPKGSEQPLHVAVARLLGYRWPRQTGSSFPDCPALAPDGQESLAEEDGIVCLPPLNHKQPAAASLRKILTAAIVTFDERALIADAGLKGSKSKTLEEWLRDEFFEQHCAIFHDRPFVWHLWDGRYDGFNALVNYHKLDYANLQKLTYSYLGDWIQQQSDDAKADKPGAAERLGAARSLQIKLAAILEGEAPLDIFVRWKPIQDQAKGWHPDLNDGIRQNIRPFLLAGDVGKRGAGLFRAVPLAIKDKDKDEEMNLIAPRPNIHGSGAKKNLVLTRLAEENSSGIDGIMFILRLLKSKGRKYDNN